jgi:nicotinate-nucleotide adenylyltransferase
MENKELQEIVNKTFIDKFGYTPLTGRLSDITNEYLELMRYTDIKNLKEETGDLLSSIIQLCNESGWDFGELVRYTCEDKISRRSEQYKSLGRKYKIALLGGAFDPITKGHIEVAQYVLNTSKQFDEVWITPAYRHIHNKDMESFEDRVEMCKLATQVDGRIKVFEYEKEKNMAGETYHLLKTLINDKDYENYNFSFIIGLDNANTFDTWVNYEELERMGKFVIVPRKGYDSEPEAWYLKNPHIFLNGRDEKFPIMEISSTDVRTLMSRLLTTKNDDNASNIKNQLFESIQDKVYEYIIQKQLYR